MLEQPVLDITIIGFGYSGALVLAQLVQQSDKALRIGIFDPSPTARRGTAYGTNRLEHLLNVRVGFMGAYPDRPDGFYQWLKSSEGQAALRSRDYCGSVDENSFVPRCFYGDYLESLSDKTFQDARQKGIIIEWHKEEVTQIESADGFLKISTPVNHFISRQLVLATGNHFRLWPQQSDMVEDLWHFDYAKLRKIKGNIAVIGARLTAVDAMLSIFKSGFAGKIICISSKGHFIQPHTERDEPYDVTDDLPLLGSGRLSSKLSVLRNIIGKAKKQGRPWQSVFDGLRSHYSSLWKAITDEDKKRFLKKYYSLWGLHRHRVPLHKYLVLTQAMEEGRIELVAARFVEMQKGKPVILQNGVRKQVDVTVTFNCSGLDRISPSAMLLPLLQKGSVRKHATGFGLSTFEGDLITAKGAPPIYAIGNLLFGEQFTVTSVPELVHKTRRVAEALLAAF